MLFTNCVNCLRILSYLFHFCTGVKCCTVHSNSPTLAQLRQIELSVDSSIDPCDDFFAHACNNWPEQHPDQSYDEVTGLVDYKVNKRLINIIESAYQHPHQVADQCQSFVQKTRIYYKSCVAEGGRNISRYFEGIKPSRDLEWPLVEELQAYRRNVEKFQLEDWPAQQFDVFALLGKLQSYGFNNVLINQEIVRTQNGSLQIMLELPYISPDDELPPHVLMELLKGWGLPELTAAKYAKEIVNIQERWHNIYQNYTQTAVDNHNRVKLSYSELGQQYRQLHTFLEHIMPQQIRPDDYVVIENLDYFDFLLNKQWPPKEPKNLSNYLMMKFLVYLLKDRTTDFKPLDCIKDLRNKMDLSVNYLYYEQIYRRMGTSYNDAIDHLSQIIVQYFMETLSENYLNLNSQQLQELKDKIRSLKVNLGNLPANTKISQIEDFYKDVPSLDQRNYYKNHLELLRHRFRKSVLYTEDLSFFVASDNLVGSSSAPIYIPKQHMVILPLGFLQPPIYDYYYHPLLVWSVIGFLLAHEFTHSIDTTGLLYGNDGRMLFQEPSIFENLNFTVALGCMQAQQPTDAIDERLADLVGARVAYKAYLNENHWQIQPQFTNIPWKKLFFLNMAQFFCGRQDIKFVDHDADAVRLREIVKNLDGFAEAFKCPVGSAMNPEKKCRLY